MNRTGFLSLVVLYIFSFSATAQDAATLYNEGLKLKEEKKSAEAAKKFEEALKLKPDHYDAMYNLGWCNNDLGNHVGALSNLRKVRSVWRPTARVFFELGYAFEKLLMYDSAVASYLQCQEVNPNYKLVNKQLGFISYQRVDYEKALDYFAKYEALVTDSITDYLYWYRKGFSYNFLKRYSDAVTVLEKAQRYKPTYINTYLELGFANSRLKKSEVAIAYYKKAIEIDPKSHIGYNGIGEVYRDYIKDMNEAMNWYKKSLAIVPNERKACFGMGYCLNSQGKYSEAIPYFQTAIEKEPDYTAAFVELGYAYYKNGLINEAVTNLNKAISLNPLNENSRYYLTLIYVDKRDKAKAQEIVDALKKLNSKHVATLQPKVDAL